MLTLRRLLVPTDGSACAEHAYAYAADLARRHRADLHVLHVRPPGHGPVPLLLPHPGTPNVHVVDVENRASTPLLGILGYAQEHAVDLIVMGTHGRRGMSRVLLGSITEDVVRLAGCPVLTIKDLPAGDPTSGLLVPVDFSHDSWLAVAYGRHLAAEVGVPLHLLHVVETLPSYGIVDVPPSFPPVSPTVEAETHRALLDLAHEAGGPEVPFHTHVVAGHPTIGVLDAVASLAPELVVLPTHGRSGFRRLVLGSVAEQVVRRAPCPVLVVRGEGRGLPSGDGADVPVALPA